MSRNVRIGDGAGFAGNRIEPAVDLAAMGRLDFLVFESLAERTIALAHSARRHDPNAGYDPLLTARMRSMAASPALSLSLDVHGKTPGMQLLDLELEKG